MTALFSKTIAFVAIASLMSGCASASDKVVPSDHIQASSLPGWVTQPPKSSNKVYGVGSAEVYGPPDQALKRAVEFARADLVSQLRVTVSSSSTSDINEYSLNGATQLQKNVRQKVASQIPKTQLDDAIVADSFVDDKYAYALVELNRVIAAQRIEEKIDQVRVKIEQAATAPETGSDPLSKLKQQLPALTLFAEFDQLANEFELFSLSRTRPQLAPNLLQYRQSIYSNLEQLKVKLTLLDSGAKAMANGLQQALTAQGLTLSEGGHFDLNVEVMANTTTRFEQKNYYVFGNTNIVLRDGAGKILSTFNKTARGVSGIEQTAIEKTSVNLAKALSEELANTLTERLQ